MNSPDAQIPWDPFNRNCASRGLLDAIGDKWSILILVALSEGPLRFGEVEKAVDGISQKMLAQRLNMMVLDGLVERHEYKEVPPRVEYRLTELGQSAVPAAQGLIDWTVGHMTQIHHWRESQAG